MNYDLQLPKQQPQYDAYLVYNTEALALAKLKLFRDARSAKDKLSLKQKELEIPKTNGVSQEQNEQLKTQWNTTVDVKLKDITEVAFDVGDGVNFNLAIDDSHKNQLKSSMINPDDFCKRYMSNGETDMTKYLREMAMLNHPNFVKSVYNQGRSAGAEAAINNISNLSTEMVGSGNQPEYKTPQQLMAEKIKDEDN